MAQAGSGAEAYICPMHSDVREPKPGQCPQCGMALVAEGARFKLLRHMAGKPLHLVLMAVLMLAVMAAAMMLTIHSGK